MIPVLQNKFKNSRIISLHAVEKFTSHENYENAAAFCGTDAESVQKFLEEELQEIDASRIQIVEWRPSLNYYKDSYVKILSIVIDFIKRHDAEKRTTAFFGKKWIKNFFKNLSNINEVILYKTTDIPVIVVGSGPGLESVLPVIRKLKDSCLIIAASSSAMALSYGGILPDIVIATDGGNWALHHIYPLYKKENTTALAVNLCAALPSQCKDTPQLIINDGSLFQNIILHELSIPSVIIPQKGTVTASAVELAMILSSGNIYLAGMDLSVSDIRTHARPYGFDNLFFGCAGRLAPVYSQNFMRSGLIQKGGSMNIYASWFKNQLDIWPKRIFSLSNSNIFINAFPSEKNRKKNTDDYLKPVKIKKDSGFYYNKGVAALLSAIDKEDYSESIKKELAPLLFPERNDITKNELKTAVTDIAACYDRKI